MLYIVYYGLPSVGILLENFTAAAAAMSITFAAYSSEIFRGGIQSVPGGQREAGLALGLSNGAVMSQIIFPQGLRAALPPLVGFIVQCWQTTSLAYSVAVSEMMGQAYQVSAATFQYVLTYTIVGLIYAAFSIPGTWLSLLIERRLDRGQTHA
jgi:polar amino acid transport system permease protein